MNILITGASGFVGRHLEPELELKGHKVTSLTSTDFDKIWFSTETFDVIIHLAVKTAAGGYCQKHPGEQFIVNSSISADVLGYWAQYQRQAKMITFGSSCAYDKNELKSENNYLKGNFIIYESIVMAILALCIRDNNLSFRSFSNHFTSCVTSLIE